MQGLHRRMNHLDTRQDSIELAMAKDYVSRASYIADQGRLEEHMIRIENKLDEFIRTYPKG